MTFDLQPILTGQLLLLRPIQASDYQGLYSAAADPLIWEQHPQKNRHQESVFKYYFREALDSSGALIAIDIKDNQIVGTSRFHGYDNEKSEVEIGWSFLARSHWGGVYNWEMKQLMLQHAFRFVNCINFKIGSKNHRSQRAAQKIGGVLVKPKPGDDSDNVIYQLTKSKFIQIAQNRTTCY